MDDSHEAAPRHRWPRRFRRRVIFAAILMMVILTMAIGLWLWRVQHGRADLPRSITSTISIFPPYFYEQLPPDDFRLDNSTVTYRQGLLVFKLLNSKKQVVTVTEQVLPADLRGSTANGDQSVTGAYGSASVSFRDGRSIGVLLGKDQKTMVVMQSTDNVGTDSLQDLLRYLRPKAN